MKPEEGWKMYIKIKQLKERGFSKVKIAKMLDISRPTVIKYLSMDIEEFEKELNSQKHRTKKPDKYRKEIIDWLIQYPDMTAAQVFDWLEEKHKKLTFNETTLRSYVRILRDDLNLPKNAIQRHYESVDDPPPGKQMQVDFGEKKVIKPDGTAITLYVMCFVLSHSRYKYCEWQSRPFNTKDIIGIHENAFTYFDGVVQEAVYDQDHLILVSENHGELIYTKEFASYLKTRRFSVYMCRKADPESKGRVEKVVDFVKDNFASHRVFYGIDRWNEDCLKWLKRRGNGKRHNITKKIPAEVFLEEKKYLQPILEKLITKPRMLSLTYQVRKDNTVPIQGNRYSVPIGTYQGPDTYVGVSKIGNNHLIIYEIGTQKELANFAIPETKGNLIKNNNHKRNKSEKVLPLMERVATKFSDCQKAYAFFEEIHKEKPRYTRDQMELIEAAITAADLTTADKALEYCVKHQLHSGVDFKDAVKHYFVQNKNSADGETQPIKGLTEKVSAKISIKPLVRDLSEYVKIMNENQGG